MSSLDPKSGTVDGRRRVLTIHDGARVTSTLVRLLSVLADEAEELASDEANSVETSNTYQRRNAYENAADRHVPILVARADGLAVYARDRRLV